MIKRGTKSGNNTTLGLAEEQTFIKSFKSLIQDDST